MQMVVLVSASQTWTSGISEQETALSRSLLAPLSPNEELTLRRVATGLLGADDLSERDLARLKSLALVDVSAGHPCLTALGNQRYRSLPGTAPPSQESSGLAERVLTDNILKARG